MAYQKTKTYQDGFTGEYWRIINSGINYESEVVNFTVVVYKDQETREDETKTPYQEDSYNFQMIFLEFTSNPKNLTNDEILTEAYQALPNKIGFFIDANII